MYSCIRISGDDRAGFLQGQLTQNVDRLSQTGTLSTAWCSPKGRVLLTGRLLACPNSIGLFLPISTVESAIARLSMYRLRAKVEFEVDETLRCLAFSAAAVRDPLALDDASALSARLGAVTTGPLHAVALGDTVEVFGTTDALRDAGLSDQVALGELHWRQARIEAGRPDIDSSNAERFTPHMLNLDRLEALSFDKGCYTGQEVVARTEHLGKVKRRLRPYRLMSAEVNVGDKLSLDGTDVGECVNVAGDLALAVVATDHHEKTLTAGHGTAEPLPLPYPLAD
ncbi:MAG: hypothetical protein AAGA44_17815 [Pseudomonadota bacterium]